MNNNQPTNREPMTLRDIYAAEEELLKAIRQHKYNITHDEHYPYEYFPKGTPVEEQEKLDQLRSELSEIIEQRNAMITEIAHRILKRRQSK